MKSRAANDDLDSFYIFLRKCIENVDEFSLQAELSGILPESELVGLDMKIKNCVLRKLPVV